MTEMKGAVTMTIVMTVPVIVDSALITLDVSLLNMDCFGFDYRFFACFCLSLCFPCVWIYVSPLVLFPVLFCSICSFHVPT